MKLEQNQQIIKTRDDRAAVVLTSLPKEDTEGEVQFRLDTPSNCSWGKDNEFVGPLKLRPRIEPWLTSLFQSEHLALLAGSGLSNAVYHIAKGALLPGMSKVTFANYGKEIES